MHRNGQEPNEDVLISHIDPCIIITSRGVFKVRDGKMKELESDPELGWKNKAFWLSHALNKDFDPGEHRK